MPISVSYTHLDVYKRQFPSLPFVAAFQAGDHYLFAADHAAEQAYGAKQKATGSSLAQAESFLSGVKLGRAAAGAFNRVVVCGS